jgi:hypothetical protein
VEEILRRTTKLAQERHECHFDLCRIRAVRFDVFFTMVDLENATSKDCAMNKIGRYEGRASSKRRSALRKINQKSI